MLFLSIETSCDETAAAVFEAGTVETGPIIRSSVVASQLALHARFGGVVPEVAARAHLQQLLPVIHAALGDAKVTLKEIGAIAVMNRPGLVGGTPGGGERSQGSVLVAGYTADWRQSYRCPFICLPIGGQAGHLSVCGVGGQRRPYHVVSLS